MKIGGEDHKIFACVSLLSKSLMAFYYRLTDIFKQCILFEIRTAVKVYRFWLWWFQASVSGTCIAQLYQLLAAQRSNAQLDFSYSMSGPPFECYCMFNNRQFSGHGQCGSLFCSYIILLFNSLSFRFLLVTNFKSSVFHLILAYIMERKPKWPKWSSWIHLKHQNLLNVLLTKISVSRVWCLSCELIA